MIFDEVGHSKDLSARLVPPKLLFVLKLGRLVKLARLVKLGRDVRLGRLRFESIREWFDRPSMLGMLRLAAMLRLFVRDIEKSLTSHSSYA
jgi:hypothetical protein